jgi:hypothetical protein
VIEGISMGEFAEQLAHDGSTSFGGSIDAA